MEQQVTAIQILTEAINKCNRHLVFVLKSTIPVNYCF